MSWPPHERLTRHACSAFYPSTSTSQVSTIVHALITSPQMSTMADHNNQRQNGYSRPNMGYGNANMGYGNQYGGRGQVGGAYGMHHSPSDMSALAHSFQGMNIASQPFAAQNKNAMMPNTGGQFGGMPVAANMPYGVTGQYMYPNAYGPATARCRITGLPPLPALLATCRLSSRLAVTPSRPTRTTSRPLRLTLATQASSTATFRSTARPAVSSATALRLRRPWSARMACRHRSNRWNRLMSHPA
jgi:hypothetical protein